jgi:hypothetical protein
MNGNQCVAARRLFSVILSIGVYLVFYNATLCHATQLARDPFLIGPTPSAGEYSLGQLVGQNPTIGPAVPSFFSGPWVGQISLPPAQTVQPGSLSHFGTTFSGGSVNGAGNANGRSARMLTNVWDNSTAGTFYVGFLVNFGTTAGSFDNNMGYRAVEFWGGIVGNDVFRSDIGYNQFFSSFGPVQQNPATAQIQMNILGAPQQILTDGPSSYNGDGETHLIVVKFALSSTALSDTVSLYLDPLTSTEPALPNASVSGINFSLHAIGTVANFGGGTGGSAFDELSVSTTFADALPRLVPEPSSTILSLVTAVALATASRRRKRQL